MSRVPGDLLVVYGGTFDPVHCGHLAVARSARDRLGAQVHLMPAADPPHRGPTGADAGDRARMLELAIAGEAGLRVDRRELERTGRSYSVETLRQLRVEFGPQRPIAMLLGADSFLGLPQWKDWQALFALSHFVVAQRPGSDLAGALPGELEVVVAGRWADSPGELLNAPAGRLWRLEQPLRLESATLVRQRIHDAGPWEALVPPAVAGYIRDRKLYRVGSA